MRGRIEPIAYLQDERGKVAYAVIPIRQLTRSIPACEAGPALPAPNPIREARLAAGLTQVALAKAIGISQAMISVQEQPGRRLRPATVARALGAIRRLEAEAAGPIAVDELLSAYAPLLSDRGKRRDPVERALLLRLGDPAVQGEDPSLKKSAGERAKPPRRRRKA